MIHFRDGRQAGGWQFATSCCSRFFQSVSNSSHVYFAGAKDKLKAIVVRGAAIAEGFLVITLVPWFEDSPNLETVKSILAGRVGAMLLASHLHGSSAPGVVV